MTKATDTLHFIDDSTLTTQEDSLKDGHDTNDNELSDKHKIIAPSIDQVTEDPNELRVSRGNHRYFGINEKTDDIKFISTTNYKDVKNLKCSNCQEYGHFKKNCPHIICSYCGLVDDHYSTHCKKVMFCSNCNQMGHYRSHCPEKIIYKNCSTCNSKLHTEDRCSSIWRSYILNRSNDKHDPKTKEKKKLVLPMHLIFCYNCASKGHFGDDCPKRRSSKVPLDDGSAFTGKNLSDDLKKQYFQNLESKKKDDYYYDNYNNSNAYSYQNHGDHNLDYYYNNDRYPNKNNFDNYTNNTSNNLPYSPNNYLINNTTQPEFTNFYPPPNQYNPNPAFPPSQQHFANNNTNAYMNNNDMYFNNNDPYLNNNDLYLNNKGPYHYQHSYESYQNQTAYMDAPYTNNTTSYKANQYYNGNTTAAPIMNNNNDSNLHYGNDYRSIPSQNSNLYYTVPNSYSNGNNYIKPTYSSIQQQSNYRSNPSNYSEDHFNQNFGDGYNYNKRKSEINYDDEEIGQEKEKVENPKKRKYVSRKGRELNLKRDYSIYSSNNNAAMNNNNNSNNNNNNNNNHNNHNNNNNNNDNKNNNKNNDNGSQFVLAPTRTGTLD
ncbi:hypothetical protein TBLA_0J01250 [Henningerozyma blattae CBS 6284]|uniref:CCHC-type domain-containing protein n=1 Tax=Henningerozyma blattae (strain ATCC 34711 / CBS 6284 / DSM 70876 / NBRC 10599 / NRRL Y-10934 / UCD 77-7) TaxID=1071380 RepID=I2H9S0_HENB6|nr:hypothetical protein TBLA_0J01250 [Tetrapisispora blattae CBS 6284]CCH63122.1 hypothetical protein TBLA_0J01250 [Tetrapisispora blattae CBS 6284]